MEGKDKHGQVETSTRNLLIRIKKNNSRTFYETSTRNLLIRKKKKLTNFLFLVVKICEFKSIKIISSK